MGIAFGDKTKKNAVGIVTPPMAQANIRPFLNLVTIVKAFSDSWYAIVTHGKYDDFEGTLYERIYEIIHKSGKNPISRIFKYTFTQAKIAWCLAKLPRNDLWIFYLGDTLILPMIFSQQKQI